VVLTVQPVVATVVAQVPPLIMVHVPSTPAVPTELTALLKVTVPVAAPGETTAVSVTGLPRAVLDGEGVSVVVVGIAVTATVAAAADVPPA
jgi:hypothetical protein